MKEDKSPWFQLKDVLKQSTIEIVNGFADISRILTSHDNKEAKKK